MNKKSPKQSSASELVDMDPKFTNVKFKFKQEVSFVRIMENCFIV